MVKIDSLSGNSRIPSSSQGNLVLGIANQTESAAFQIPLNSSNRPQSKTTIPRKCRVCKQPLRGHQGPSGKGKCRNGTVSNKESYIETLSDSEIDQIPRNDGSVTPPTPVSDTRDQGDMETFVFQNRSFLQNLDEISSDLVPVSQDDLIVDDDQVDKVDQVTQPIVVVEDSSTCKAKPVKRKAEKELKTRKKAKKSGFDYFLPMQKWKNVYSQENLIEPLIIKSKHSSVPSKEVEEITELGNTLLVANTTVENLPNATEKNTMEVLTSGDINTPENVDLDDGHVNGDQDQVKETQERSRIIRGRPMRKCQVQDCVNCNVTENCGKCRNCSNRKLKAKCIKRYCFLVKTML